MASACRIAVNDLHALVTGSVSYANPTVMSYVPFHHERRNKAQASAGIDKTARTDRALAERGSAAMLVEESGTLICFTTPCTNGATDSEHKV